MKIGVDARVLHRGLGRYTLEMCRALVRIKEISLHLYSPAPINLDHAKGLETSLIRTAHFKSQVSKQFWSETYLPSWARKDEVDVFWGPAHRLPHWLPDRTARVVTIHDLVWKYAGKTMRPLSRILERTQMPNAVKRAHHIVADSQATANSTIEEFHIPKNKITIIPLGANHLTVTSDPLLLKSMDILHPYCLFVGTLEPRKNLMNLLIAYSKLSESTKKKTRLLIAGGKGWGGVDLKKMIEDLNLTDYTKILGYVDDRTLSVLYAHAQFLVMPSLYEGFGLPLVEAMACGTPVLTSNNSSMKEVAGDAGILVDPLDTDSIKKGLEQLITNDALRAELSLKSKERASQFNWDRSAEQLLSVFKKACNDLKVAL